MLNLINFLALMTATLVMCGWLLALFRTWRTINAMRRLPSALHDDQHRTKISVVIAARNEAAGIEASITSLLAQEGVDLDVIVVDDGSEDDTPTILKRISEQHRGRLLVLSSKKVPPGWVAKNYALELGQGRARGDYLLFSDADVVHGPRAIGNAIATMERERLDHLAVHPRVEAGSLSEALTLPLFVLLCQLRFVDPRAAEPDSGVGSGIGAFNLVRADAYRLRGTHARIRGAMLDDRALGRMMREDKGRGTLMRAVGQVRLRPYTSFKALYAGIQKSVLGTFGNSAALTFVMGLVLLAGAVMPILLVVLGLPLWLSGHAPWVVVPALVSIILPMLGLLKARTVLRFEPLAALLFPIGALVISVAALQTALVFAITGNVAWRGRLYTKRDLINQG